MALRLVTASPSSVSSSARVAPVTPSASQTSPPRPARASGLMMPPSMSSASSSAVVGGLVSESEAQKARLSWSKRTAGRRAGTSR